MAEDRDEHDAGGADGRSESEVAAEEWQGGAAEGSGAADADPPADRSPADAPLEDLANEIRDRGETEGAAGETEEAEFFETVEVGEVDDEAVWESFVEGQVSPEERVGVGTEVVDAERPDEHVVPKRDFCQRCPHFAVPPETACTREGTTIVEVLEGDRFRVRNCPIAAERDAVPGDPPGE